MEGWNNSDYIVMSCCDSGFPLWNYCHGMVIISKFFYCICVYLVACVQLCANSYEASIFIKVNNILLSIQRIASYIAMCVY